MRVRFPSQRGRLASRRVWRLLWLGVALVAPALAPAAIDADGFLQTDGTVIKDRHGRGRIVTLRGTNLGGWLMQEDWMSPNGYAALSRRLWQTQLDAGGRTIDLGAWSTFGRVVLGLAPTSLAAAQHWSVEVSPDGTRWRPARVERIALLDHEVRLELDQGYTARQLRLRSTGADAGKITGVTLEQNDDYTLRIALQERFGADVADQLIRGYQRTWLTEHDLDHIHRWGLNVVRVPMNWLDFMTPAGEWKPDALATLDWLVAACAARSLYVILDLHAAPGGASPWASSGHAGDDGTGQNPNGFWTNPALQERTAELWRRLARHFRGNPTIAGYDLVNEPLFRSSELPAPGEKYSAAALAKSACFDRLYRAVREVDPDHIVIVAAFALPPPGSPPDAPMPSAFLGITPPEFHGWTNVVYQTHYYDMAHPRDRDAQARLVADALADMARCQREWKVPIYAGEYSLYRFYDVWERWMQGLNRLHISWTNWTYKVRGTAEDPAGTDWGFYHTNRHPSPDANRDTPAEIAAKWSQFGTEQFQRNESLIEVVTRCAAAAEPSP